jgi:hypothetical protein
MKYSISELNRLYTEVIIEGYREEFIPIGVEQGVKRNATETGNS